MLDVSVWVVWAMFVVVAVQRLAELKVAQRNARWARSRGGREFGRAHYPWLVAMHTLWLVAWVAEALLRGPALAPAWPLWLGLFVGAQGLRYWAIASLGRLWNTRILVVPDEELVRAGPYRFLRHPNYLAVVLELAVVPLLFGAWLTAMITTVVNLAFLSLIRIPEEERALAAH